MEKENYSQEEIEKAIKIRSDLFCRIIYDISHSFNFDEDELQIQLITMAIGMRYLSNEKKGIEKKHTIEELVKVFSTIMHEYESRSSGDMSIIKVSLE